MIHKHSISRVKPNERTSRGLAARIGLGTMSIALSVVLLVLATLMSESSLVLRTWLSCLGGLTCLWGWLFYRYGRQIPLRLDVMAVVGFSLTALAPPLYLVTRLDTGVHVDDYRVADMFPAVALWTTVGAVALLLGYALSHHRRKPLPATQPVATASFLPVLISIVVIAWLARLVLVTQGAYYYVYHDDDFVFGRWFSVLGGIARYGLVGPLTLCLLAAKAPRYRAAAIVATVAEILYILPSGARKETLQLLLAFVLVVWWVRHRIPVLLLSSLLALGLVAVPIVGQYRYTISQSSDFDRVAVGSTVEAARNARTLFDDTVGSDVWTYADSFTNRLYDGQLFGYLLKHYYDVYPAERGATYYTRVPWLLVPYFIYPDRPIMQVALDDWFALVGYGSNPTTILGEAYLNFGFAGIPIMAFVIGIVLGLFDRFFEARLSNPFAAGIAILTAALTPSMTSTNLASWLGILRDSVLMYFVLAAVQYLVSRGAAGRQSIHAQSHTILATPSTLRPVVSPDAHRR